jgi:hypothetical protein
MAKYIRDRYLRLTACDHENKLGNRCDRFLASRQVVGLW